MKTILLSLAVALITGVVRVVGAEVGGVALHADAVPRTPEIEHLAGLLAKIQTGERAELQASGGAHAELVARRRDEICKLRIGPDESAGMIGFGPPAGGKAIVAGGAI